MADNKITIENAIVEGRAPKSYWDVPHSNQIEGFATDFSVNAGSHVDFKINVNGGAGSDYKVEIFRLGYYGGSGAREVAEWTNTSATVQPQAIFQASRGMVDAGNWSVTDGWNVPSTAVSGVYLARLQRLDASGNPINGAVNQIPFIVRNDGVDADIVLQTSDTTWHAYNGWAGNNGQVGANLYGDPSGRVDWDPIPGAGLHSQDRAYAVSYNRPFITRDGTSTVSGGQDYLFGADYAAIFWLEKNGYDVSYMSGVDTDRLGASYLTNYKAYISVGHDEYWSGGQRDNVEAARDAGVNLLFWSGNECYWKTRWEDAISADGTPYRTLVCYKETLAVADPNARPGEYVNLDPTDIWTGTWRDVRFHGNPRAGGGNPGDVDPITGLNPACHCGENQLIGQLFGPDGTGQFGGALDVPASFAGLRVWRDTTIASGGKLDIAPGILGYEWDTSPEDHLRPAGLIKLSETTIPWNGILVDQGNTVLPGVATHNLSLYQDDSGALVFGAGTVFWSWAFSNNHDSSPYGAQIQKLDIQQFTINMFADMGIQPGVTDAFLISQGLKRAGASSDTRPAVATINDLPDEIAALSTVTISGTATDNDGNPGTVDGKVAVVEVSIDAGLTWRVAKTTDAWATWTYSWNPSKLGDQTILSRAIDDSLNTRNALPDAEIVTITAPTTYSLFNGGIPVGATLDNDATAVELGMRFSVDRAGSITQLKYYRAAGDAGDTDVRDGHLWRADGTLLATVTFTSGVGVSGWQTATLSSPVALAPGGGYIVSYRTLNNYVSTGDFFSPDREVAFDGLNNNAFSGPFGVVQAPQSEAGAGNGLFVYGSGAPRLPVDSFNAGNYWVDVTFNPAAAGSNQPPTITSPASFSVQENRLSVATITATDPNANVLTYAIAGGVDAARFTINSATGALAFVTAANFEAPTDANGNNVYQLNVSVSDGIAPPVTQAVDVTVTDVNETGTVSRLFGAGDTPSTTKTDNSTDYELGAKFVANAGGWITDLRYFRGTPDANDTDVRTLNLWTATGTRLGQVTVTSGTGASGWQVGTLAAPIAIQANTTYIVSYGTIQNYAFSQNYFGSAHSGPDGVLTGLASGASGGNGVFAEGSPGVFPTGSFNASNYWVDVSFQTSLAANSAPTITSPAAFSAAEHQTRAGQVTATDSNGDPLTYAIAGGADAALFTINATNGVVSFRAIPDFEAPADAGANNVYNLTVSVSDGKAPAVQQAVAVTVTNQPENGPPTIAPITAPTTNEDAAAVQINLLAGASDPEGSPVTVTGPVTAASSNAARTVVVSVSAAGVLTLNPAQFGDLAAGQSETVTVSYTITDGVTAPVSNTATITVEGRDDVVGGLVLTGNSSANTLNGGEGPDTIRGLGGNDTLRGNGGNDLLDGGTGTDTVDGGNGADVILIRGTEAQTGSMAGGAGIDTIRVEGTADVVLSGTGSISGVEIFDGFGQELAGTSSANVFDLSIFTTVSNLAAVLGLSGNDTLTGSAGSDRLDGGVGTDTVNGGGGDDTIVVRSSQAQTDTMNGGGGQDLILVDPTAGDLIIASSQRITAVEGLNGAGVAIRGTSSANVLDFSGIAVSNVSAILGLGGNDTLAGGTAADTLTGGTGNDIFVFRLDRAAGADTITDFDVGSNDKIRLEGFGPGVNVAAATSFDAQGALIDLDALGGDGSIRLNDVTGLTFTTTEDFLFA